MKVQNRYAVGAAALALMAGSALGAPELRDLGHGWQVLIPDADLIDIVVDEAASTNGRLVLEKFATFISLDALDLVFSQTAPNALTATQIFITDEYISNQSGVAWTAFANSLVDQTNVAAVWNQAASAGLSIAPFTVAAFTAGNTVVTFSGGVVPHMGFWFPGVTSGALVMNLTLDPRNSTDFRGRVTLREQPTGVPTPGATVLALIAGGMMASRRRRG